MGLSHIRKTWNLLGEMDPLWAILTHAEKQGGRWDLDEFLQTGEEEIVGVLARVAEVAPDLDIRRALDFGCGVGRLCQALARRIAEVHGVDISAAMLLQARRIEAARSREAERPGRCVFHENARADLRLFDDGSFDLIYSNITLQHMPPALQDAYLGEFCRVLAPGGLMVFQLPEGPRQPLNWRGRWLRRARRLLPRRLVMEMHGQPRAAVEARIAALGCRVVVVERDGWAGPDWVSARYIATKASGPGGKR